MRPLVLLGLLAAFGGCTAEGVEAEPEDRYRDAVVDLRDDRRGETVARFLVTETETEISTGGGFNSANVPVARLNPEALAKARRNIAALVGTQVELESANLSPGPRWDIVADIGAREQTSTFSTDLDGDGAARGVGAAIGGGSGGAVPPVPEPGEVETPVPPPSDELPVTEVPEAVIALREEGKRIKLTQFNVNPGSLLFSVAGKGGATEAALIWRAGSGILSDSGAEHFGKRTEGAAFPASQIDPAVPARLLVKVPDAQTMVLTRWRPGGPVEWVVTARSGDSYRARADGSRFERL